MRLRQLLKTCLLFAVTWTFAYGQTAANLEMTIHVHDYAGIDPSELDKAEAFAARILHEAGLRTQWSNCRFSPVATALRTCASATGGVTHLYIRLLPEAMAGKLAAPTRMLGMSVPTSRGTFPADAYVFAERVRVFAEQDRVAPLLGAAITHEVGHLLLAGRAHAVAGIMSAQWGKKEKKHALMGGLTFNRRESEQIRADVSQRMSGSNERAQMPNEEPRIEPNRPSQIDSTLRTAVAVPASPSYPSEHAAAAGAAAGVLSFFFPEQASAYQRLAEEASRSRLFAGVQYPSDYTAGLELGRQVAQKVVERAANDGYTLSWSGTVPTGRCLGTGATPGGVTAPNWKPLLLSSPGDFRPPPPPDCDRHKCEQRL